MSGADTVSEYFKEVCCEFEKEQVIDGTLSSFIEQNTTGQGKCQLWKMLHNGRLKSSVVSEIMHWRDSANPDSILWRIVGYKQMIGCSVVQGKRVSDEECLCCRNEKPGGKRFAMQNDKTDTATVSFLLGCLMMD